MPLTNTAIRNAKAGKKTLKLFDERGLYLEVSPAGGKWWRLKYRFGGKEKRLSLGIYPDVALKDARDRRDHSRKLLTDGVDPSEYRKATKAAQNNRDANSFELITREWFAKYSPRDDDVAFSGSLFVGRHYRHFGDGMDFVIAPVNGIVLGHRVSRKILNSGFDRRVHLMDY